MYNFSDKRFNKIRPDWYVRWTVREKYLQCLKIKISFNFVKVLRNKIPWWTYRSILFVQSSQFSFHTCRKYNHRCSLEYQMHNTFYRSRYHRCKNFSTVYVADTSFYPPENRFISRACNEFNNCIIEKMLHCLCLGN